METLHCSITILLQSHRLYPIPVAVSMVLVRLGALVVDACEDDGPYEKDHHEPKPTYSCQFPIS